MRKVFAVLLGVLAVMCTAQTARAEEYNTYYIDEWGFEIGIPEECIVFTRDVDENHPGLEHFGFTAEALLEVLESGYIYIDAIESSSAYEIVVVVQNDSAGNMKDWNEELLEVALQSRQTYLKSKGHQCISAQIVQHAQATFLQNDYSSTSGQTTIYVREYYTRYNNTMYGVSLTTFGKELNGEQEEIL